MTAAIGLQRSKSGQVRQPYEPTRWTWQDHGACRGASAMVFFGTGEHEIAEARAMCARCPVRMTCLSFALERAEPFGIWGGATERERASMSDRARRSIARAADREAQSLTATSRVVRGL